MKIVSQVFLFFLLTIVLFLAASRIYNHFHSKSLVFNVNLSTSKHCCTQPIQSKDTVRILIIDGGGIAGIMPLVILNYLEQQSGKPVSQLFDLFAGTSTGTIIISALNLPDKHGKPKFSTKQIIDLYVSLSKSAMFSSVYRKILTVDGILGPKFSGKRLHEELVKEGGGNIEFHTLMNHIAMTAYNLSTSQLEIFKNWDCSPQRRFSVPDLISAATATPSFYSPVIFKDAKNGISNVYVDGMVFANNPSFFALEEAFSLYPKAKKYIIVHLGTGVFPTPNLSDSNTEKWGFLQWAVPLASIIYESRGKDLKQAMRSIKSISTDGKIEDFYFNLDFAGHPFNTTKENINDIKTHAHLIISQRKAELNYLARILSKHY